MVSPRLNAGKWARLLCTAEAVPEASTSAAAPSTTADRTVREEWRNIDYYNRLLVQLLGRNEYQKAIRVFQSIKEDDVVCFSKEFITCLDLIIFECLY